MIVFGIESVLDHCRPEFIIGDSFVDFRRTAHHCDAQAPWRRFLVIILVPHPPAIGVKDVRLFA